MNIFVLIQRQNMIQTAYDLTLCSSALKVCVTCFWEKEGNVKRDHTLEANYRMSLLSSAIVFGLIQYFILPSKVNIMKYVCSEWQLHLSS